MQSWTSCCTRNLSRSHAEELLALQAFQQPLKSGSFLWDRVYGILSGGLRLPADQLHLQTQKLTWGSLLPVISLLQKWVTESERSRVKSVPGSNDVHSQSVWPCASSSKGLQLVLPMLKRWHTEMDLPIQTPQCWNMPRGVTGHWARAWTLANNSGLI